MLLTRSPLYSSTEVDFLARLACVRHAASVHSEPGSNSSVEIYRTSHRSTTVISFKEFCSLRYINYPSPCFNKVTEVRWFLSIQFSKSLVPWRAYQSRALGALCQALFGALTGARLPVPHDMGSATIRKLRATVNPLRKVFSADALRLLKTQPTAREKVREIGGKNKRWGKSSKARKACLGWNSRQDGGRLVERS